MSARVCVICSGLYAPGDYGTHKLAHPRSAYSREARFRRLGARTTSQAVAITVAIKAGGTGASVSRVLGVSREYVRQVWQRETGMPLPTKAERQQWRAS